MADAYSFSEDAARRIVGAVRRVEGMSPAPGNGSLRDRLSRGEVLVQLTVNVTGNQWQAIEVDVLGVTVSALTGAREWDDTDPVIVLGPPGKIGLVMIARKVGNKDGATTWLAHGYESRVLDWGDPNGTGNTGPFVYEGGAMKIKTWKTDDGLTWTQEKIDMTAGGLAGTC